MTATKAKVAVTINAEALRLVRDRVERGELESVSAFVDKAVLNQLDADQEFHELVEADLAATGGPLTPDERAWISSILSDTER